MLDDSEAAVNSALQRARARMATEHREGSLARAQRPSGAGAEALVMYRFQEAWKAVDIDGILALLTADALLTMPPEGMRFEGADAIAEFFATVPLEGRLDRIRLVSRRANGQPALAAYAENPATGEHEAYGVMVFAIDGDQITGITGFPRQLELFVRFGLPAEITG